LIGDFEQEIDFGTLPALQSGETSFDSPLGIPGPRLKRGFGRKGKAYILHRREDAQRAGLSNDLPFQQEQLQVRRAYRNADLYQQCT
jgi:hypothetical protein